MLKSKENVKTNITSSSSRTPHSHYGINNGDKNEDNTDSLQTSVISDNELTKIYTPETRAKAVTLLLYFSILMIVIPFSTMYFCNNYVFHVFDAATNTLYSGIVAIVAVYILVGIFIYIAYNDEKIIKKRLNGKLE